MWLRPLKVVGLQATYPGEKKTKTTFIGLGVPYSTLTPAVSWQQTPKEQRLLVSRVRVYNNEWVHP